MPPAAQTKRAHRLVPRVPQNRASCFRAGDQIDVATRACAVVGALDDIILLASGASVDDPLLDAALVAQQALLLALHQPPLLQVEGQARGIVEHRRLPRGKEATALAASNGPVRRALLDRLKATAFGWATVLERRALIDAVVDEGHALRAYLSRPGLRRGLQALRNVREHDDLDASSIPRLVATAGAVAEEYSSRYRKTLDWTLLVTAIVAAAQEAERGERARAGLLRSGALGHLQSVRALIASAGLSAAPKGTAAEYSEARARNLPVRKLIARSMQPEARAT